MVKRFDKGRDFKIRRTDAGGMIVEAYPSRVGVFEYILPNGKIQRELRRPEEVFKADSLDAFQGIPLTIEHPLEMVSSKNFAKYSVGTVLEKAVQDGTHTKTFVAINRDDAIALVESRQKTQLSVGYSCVLKDGKGVWEGQEYDVEQINIIPNHLGLCAKGRHGPTASLKLDSEDGIEGCENDVEIYDKIDSGVKTKGGTMKVKIGGVDFEIDDTAAQALQIERDALSAKLDSAIARADEAAKKEVELKEKLDSIDIGALVKERQELIARCQKVDKDVDISLDNEAMIRSVVEKAVKLDSEKSDAYIQARFDAMLEDIEKKQEKKADSEKAVSSLVDKKDKEDSKPSGLSCLTNRVM